MYECVYFIGKLSKLITDTWKWQASNNNSHRLRKEGNISKWHFLQFPETLDQLGHKKRVEKVYLVLFQNQGKKINSKGKTKQQFAVPQFEKEDIIKKVTCWFIKSSLFAFVDGTDKTNYTRVYT